MTAPNTTPGPWGVRNSKPRIVHAGGKYICNALISNGPPKNNQKLVEEAMANARLIAAVQELYEALAGAIGALEFSRDYHSDLGNEDQAFAQDKLDAATKALAKARGEA